MLNFFRIFTWRFLNIIINTLTVKTNFKISKNNNDKNQEKKENQQNLTKEEFEDYVVKTGAVGSFMIFRSKKKDDELGLEEL